MRLSLWKMTLLLLVAEAVIAQTTPEETTTELPATDEPPTTTPDAAEAVRRSWAKVESMLKSTVDTQLRRLLPQMLRASGEAGMSPECQAANFKVMLGLRQLKSWAIRRSIRRADRKAQYRCPADDTTRRAARKSGTTAGLRAIAFGQRPVRENPEAEPDDKRGRYCEDKTTTRNENKAATQTRSSDAAWVARGRGKLSGLATT
ncbi:hypothetical protein MRX96_021499 [Rhipicephalus microplus]